MRSPKRNQAHWWVRDEAQHTHVEREGIGPGAEHRNGHLELGVRVLA